MSEEKKTPKMESGSDGKSNSADEKEKKNTSGDSSEDKGSESDSKDSKKDSNSKSDDGKDSKGGTESKAEANEKGGQGGKMSGLAVGDDAGGGLAGAAGITADKESKGGADTKADKEMFGNKSGGKSGERKKKPLGKRLASLGSKISMAAHAALTAFKTMVLMQLLAMLQALVTAIATAVASLVSAIVTAVVTAVTTVATVLGVSVAVAAVAMIGGIIGVVAVVAVVVVGVVVNNTAVKDEAMPCEEVNMEYMEVPDEIPVEAWTNAKLVYTFFKSYGNAAVEASGDPSKAYTDEMIAGILGNWYHESKIDTTAVETVFDEPYAIGPKKRFLWQGGVKIWENWDYDSEIGWYYVSTTIDPFYEFSETVGFLADASGDDTVDIIDPSHTRGYGVSRYVTVTHEPILYEVKWFQDLYQVSYWDTYPAIEYMGLGLGQWTNGRNTGLLEYAAENNRDWYDIDLQLMYCLSEPAGSFFADWVGETGISSYTSLQGTTYTDGMTYDGVVVPQAAEIASACEDFFVDWEAGGIGGATASGTADVRIQNALMWYNIISEWQEGVDYVLGTGSSLWNTLDAASAIASDVTQSANARSCTDLTFMGNASLAEAMVSYAWAPDKDDHNDGTLCWQHLHSTLAPGDPYKRSCDRTVAIGVWWSGTDSDYPLGSTVHQLQYLLAEDAAYRSMLTSTTTAGATNDTAWWMKVDMSEATTVEEFIALLQPGDVLIRNDGVEVPPGYTNAGVGHTLCYVGPETVQRRWPDADSSFCIVSGSLNTRSPGTGKFSYGGNGPGTYESYYVFRNMKTYCADESRTQVALTCAGHSNEQ